MNKSHIFISFSLLAKSDLSKANSMKHKLENICRELQKENKRIKVCNF